jgi:hypothetical protein
MDTNQIRKEGQLNNIVVGGLLASGAIAFGVSCYGRQVDLIEYCFQPNNSPQFCTPDKRYLMPSDEFSRILNDPLTDEDRVIAQKASRLRILPATNPYRTYLRSQEEAASRLSISRTKQRLILVVA